MRKKVFAVLIVGVILVGGYLFSKWFFRQPCTAPARPPGVPTSAAWLGDCDGGEWVELVAASGDTYRFRIYRDWDGALMLDANFDARDCGVDISAESIGQVIAYYELSESGEARLLLRSPDKPCALVAIPPAYDGEDMEFIKQRPDGIAK